MSRQLVTCPVCKTDQHVYKMRIANHDDGTIRCTGSGTPTKMSMAKGVIKEPQTEDFITQLRAQTKKAQEKSELERNAERARASSAMEARANSIIAQIQSTCNLESLKGRSHAIIMGLNYNEYDSPGPNGRWDVCPPTYLKGPAILVYNYCVDAGLSPTIEYWHDGVGMHSGFNIVAHW